MKPYYDEDEITIYHGTCEEVLPALGLGTVDMMFTSPPYNKGAAADHFGHYSDTVGMRQRGGGGKWTGGALADGYADYDDALGPGEYDEWQRQCLEVMWGCLSDRGAIFYNNKPRVRASSLWTPLDVNPGLPVRQIVTWARSGGINFALTHYLPTYEWIVIFAKQGWRLKSQGASGVGDVWRVPQESNTRHPAPFPIGLPARAIETAAPRMVVDPFMGSGTTLRAAKDVGVPAVGIEPCEAYCEIAANRLAQGSLFGAAS